MFARVCVCLLWWYFVASEAKVLNFDWRESTAALHNAMAGWGTDELTLTRVLVKHTRKERIEIAKYYKTEYNQKLEDDIAGETSGSYRTALLSLLLTPAELYAYFLNKAMSGAGTDERLLSVVLSSVPSEKMSRLRRAYEKKYGWSLTDSLKHELSGDILNLLFTVAYSNRQEEGWVDKNLAQKDAMDLAGMLSSTPDKIIFNNVFSTRSSQQLRRTFDIFQNLTNTDIVKFIRNKYRGHYAAALQLIAEYAMDSNRFFCRLLYDSINNRYDSNIITWILVGQSESNLGKIKTTYEQIYKTSLKSDLRANTGGDYRDLVMELLKLY